MVTVEEVTGLLLKVKKAADLMSQDRIPFLKVSKQGKVSESLPQLHPERGIIMFWILAVVLIVFFLSSAIKILREYERGVIFRLGRVITIKGPGLIILIPVIDKMVKVSLRLVTMDVPPQDVITRDNVSVKVNAVIYFRVMDPNKATIEVENYIFATSQLAQTTLRSVCGQVELDELLAQRDKINAQLTEHS